MTINTEKITTHGDDAKIWSGQFILLFCISLMLYMGLQMGLSMAAKYADYLGATSTIVGLTSSLFAFSALFLKLISAPVIDTFNKKLILVGAIGILCVALFGYSISHSIPVLMFFCLLQGCGQAFTATCILALVADSLPVEKLGTGIAMFSLSQVISQAVAPAVGLNIAEAVGYNRAFFIGACILMLSMLIATRLKVKHVRTKKLKISLNNAFAKEAILPAIIIFLMSMAAFVVSSFLIIYAGEVGVGSKQIGYFFTVTAVTLLVTRPLIGRLTEKYGYVKILVPSMIAFAASYFIISISTNIWYFLVAAVVNSFGFGACMPAMQALCIKSVSKERRGAGSSTNYIASDIGVLTGPVIAGVVIQAVGYTNMWRIMTIPIILGIVILIVFRKSIDAKGSASQEE